MIINFKMVNYKFYKFFVFFLIFSFILTGIGNYLIFDDFDDYVVKINGRKIDYTILEQMAKIEFYQYKKKNNADIAKNEDYKIKEKIYQNVLSKLIDEILLAQYAEKLGLLVSEKRIKNVIFSIPDFHIDNKFSKEKFNIFLKNVDLTFFQYLNILKEKLIIQQLIHGISCGTFLLPIEVNELLKVICQSRKVRLAKFDPIRLKKNISSSGIQYSFDLNQDQFFSSEMFKVNFFLINRNDLYDQCSLNEEEIKSWYNKHINQFVILPKKRYSIIYTDRIDKAYEYFRRIHQGENFNILAKSVSIDPISAKKGGNIGWVDDCDSVFHEIKIANLKEIGQFSGIIKTSKGYSIIRLDQIQSREVFPLNVVYNYVVNMMKKEKSYKHYIFLKKRVMNILNKNNETYEKKLNNLEIIINKKIKKTDWLNSNQIPVLLNSDKIKSLLINKSMLGIDGKVIKKFQFIDIDEHCFCVFSFIDYLNEKAKSFVEMVVGETNIVEKQKQLSYQTQIHVQNVLKNLKEKKKEEYEILKNSGFEFGAFRVFNFLCDNSILTRKIFSLPVPKLNEISYEIVNNEEGDIILVALHEVFLDTMNCQNNILSVDKLNFLFMNNAIFDTLLMYLRSVAKIKINEKFFVPN
ncbi:MAG: periplasmic folding chaperone [Candidatus Westeberhardia cardiocondylae]|nr:periplasmic folding chaperone [Candidatus Westeberhardia cardiocondylae]